MTVLYVVSDQEGAGKTALCATLAHLLGQQGKEVAVFKPFSSGVADSDASAYGKLLGANVEGWPVDAGSGDLSSGALDALKSVYASISQGKDVVVVEGSNALSHADSRRVADALDAKVIVVAQYRQDISSSALKSVAEGFGERTLGVVVNGMTRYMGTDVESNLMPSLQGAGLNVLGVIPEDRRLLGVSVSGLVDHLGGTVLGDVGDMDGLVEYLMIGGNGLDAGDVYFGIHDNRAVIARGNRPDIQMSALATPGTMACLVATNGVEPIEYVRYEAEQEEVPIVLVEADTLTTMDSLNGLMDKAKFDHALKMQRFAELLEEHVDLQSLYSEV